MNKKTYKLLIPIFAITALSCASNQEKLDTAALEAEKRFNCSREKMTIIHLAKDVYGFYGCEKDIALRVECGMFSGCSAKEARPPKK